jgi:hypothetical protein
VPSPPDGLNRSTDPDNPGTLPILDIPFAFSQMPLMTSRQFLNEAKKWDFSLTLRDLEELNQLGFLIPMYRADDEGAIEFIAYPHADDESLGARYSRLGRLRDPAVDEDRSLWPHQRPDDSSEEWWDGYLYSEWQLLGLRDAISARASYRVFPSGIEDGASWCAGLRAEHVALAALSARWLPRIVGKVTLRDGAKRDALRRARHDFGSEDRLRAAGFPPSSLRVAAESLLSRAHTYDPMREWWELIRHSNYMGWFRMRGSALEAIWQRIAAEVFLRAHEEMAEENLVEPLPAANPDAKFWNPLMERIGRRQTGEGIERSLSRLGLAPTPRVLLVLEGDTEVIHLRALLDELGIGSGREVRLHKQGTSSGLPKQLARYLAPGLGGTRRGLRQVDRGPTALIIAMDQEGTEWGDAARIETSLRNLRRQVESEVAAQGGKLTKDELGLLVQARTWGEQRYELANFTDTELEVALHRIATPRVPNSRSAAEEKIQLRRALSHARNEHLDLKVVFDRMGWLEEKVKLARLLLPTLLAHLDHENAESHEHPPAIQLAYDVHALVQRLSGGAFHLATPIPSVPEGPSAAK